MTVSTISVRARRQECFGSRPVCWQVELHKVRPVDVLEQLLEGGSKEHLENFFKSYGKEEAAAMCLILATNHSPVAKVRLGGLGLAWLTFGN